MVQKEGLPRADRLKGGEPQRGPEKPRGLLLRRAFPPEASAHSLSPHVCFK